MNSVIESMKRSVVWLTAAYAICGVAIASVGALYTHQVLAGPPPDDSEIVPIRRLLAEPVFRQQKRKVFPYSIVPGGAQSLREAKRAMSDPAVATHYAGFDLTLLKQVTLTDDMVGYVSYRYGDNIYWTAKKIRLKKGETVFTDGTHIARGRCLNCYSAYPMMPTRPTEPSQKAMDSPVEIPLLAMEYPLLPIPEGRALPPTAMELTPTAPVLSGQTLRPGGGFWFPLIPFFPPIHRHHPNQPGEGTGTPPGTPPVTPPSGPGGGNPTPPVPPVLVTPEPQYGWIALGAFSLMALIAAKRRHARGR